MKDPVCGMEVGETGKVFSHNGKEYRFCCASCRWAFENNPEQFENESYIRKQFKKQPILSNI